MYTMAFEKTDLFEKSTFQPPLNVLRIRAQGETDSSTRVRDAGWDGLGCALGRVRGGDRGGGLSSGPD